MTNIYDIILNFTTQSRILEFYEWEKEDEVDHIKKIPLIRISSQQLYDFINNDLQINKEILNEIKGKTITYKRNMDLEYSMLITDLNKVIAVEFDKRGNLISKSGLLLDEEEQIIEEAYDLKEILLKYSLKDTKKMPQFLTRSELKKRNYLLKEIDSLYKNKNLDKLCFLYEELYKKDDLSFNEKYLRIKNDIDINYSAKHNKLYDIVRLTYIKK